MAYATLAQVRKELAFEAANTGDDSLLTDLIARAQAWIDAETGWSFEAAAATRYYDPTRNVVGAELRVEGDLLTVTTLTNGDGAVVTASQYVLVPANTSPKYAVRLKSSTGLYWTWLTDPENAITLVGTWGYATAAPKNIELATIKLAAYLYRQRDAQQFEVTSAPGQGEQIVPQGIPRTVWQTIRAYRRRT